MDRGMGKSPAASGNGPATVTNRVAAREIRGFVKGGVVHFVEGELPDGVFVKITPERG